MPTSTQPVVDPTSKRPDKLGGARHSRVAALALALATAASASLVSAPAVSATPARTAAIAAAAAPQVVSFDQAMTRLINQARQQAGSPPLTQARGLTQLALAWSRRMNSGATGYQLMHNAGAWNSLTIFGAANRSTWGENVGTVSTAAASAAGLFQAYMRSPGHRANILNRKFHYLGTGTVSGSHGTWNTIEFTDAVQPGQAVVTPRTVAAIGHLDAASGGKLRASVVGWSLDPHRPTASNTVNVLVDGRRVVTTPARNPRADVFRVFHIAGNHGFALAVAATAGRHTICTVGLPDGPYTVPRALGCSIVTVTR